MSSAIISNGVSITGRLWSGAFKLDLFAALWQSALSAVISYIFA